MRLGFALGLLSLSFSVLTACGPKSGADGDGDGFSVGDGDCDDADATVHPGARDRPYDGVDNEIGRAHV